MKEAKAVAMVVGLAKKRGMDHYIVEINSKGVGR